MEWKDFRSFSSSWEKPENVKHTKNTRKNNEGGNGGAKLKVENDEDDDKEDNNDDDDKEDNNDDDDKEDKNDDDDKEDKNDDKEDMNDDDDRENKNDGDDKEDTRTAMWFIPFDLLIGDLSANFCWRVYGCFLRAPVMQITIDKSAFEDIYLPCFYCYITVNETGQANTAGTDIQVFANRTSDIDVSTGQPGFTADRRCGWNIDAATACDKVIADAGIDQDITTCRTDVILDVSSQVYRPTGSDHVAFDMMADKQFATCGNDITRDHRIDIYGATGCVKIITDIIHAYFFIGPSSGQLINVSGESTRDWLLTIFDWPY